MGAGAEHSPGQHTFEHGLLANAKQPSNNSPDFFTKHNFTQHNHSEHQPAGTDESEHKCSGHFGSNRDRSNRVRIDRHRQRDITEFEPARLGNSGRWIDWNRRR